jgi:hypothetical protein
VKALIAIGLAVTVQTVTGGTLWLSAIMERRLQQKPPALVSMVPAEPSRASAAPPASAQRAA